MASTGFVSLVGAGPGHPDHLTLKALRCLQEADLVLYDALVSKEVCALATKALRINVGKRGGGDQTPQPEIERVMIEAARHGLRIVRLKGGDPFVFGRGGEEALALQRAGVPCDVVPGVTTAIAAPALAGIPVTHRGLSSGFVVLTGSDLESVDGVAASIVPASLTLVVLMAVAVRARLADALLARGWDAATPAAVVRGASTPEMSIWRGTLAELRSVDLPQSSAPGTIVIGAVAALPISITDVKGVNHVRA
jgi:uroporphyrin-III C-methyltransferase/precorrin-2 dehydrogenase/sirohydrochlorin ferrochelatase